MILSVLPRPWVGSEAAQWALAWRSSLTTFFSLELLLLKALIATEVIRVSNQLTQTLHPPVPADMFYSFHLGQFCFH